MSDIHACKVEKQVKHLYALFQSVFEDQSGDPSKMPEWNLTELDIERVKEDIIVSLHIIMCHKLLTSLFLTPDVYN